MDKEKGKGPQAVDEPLDLDDFLTVGLKDAKSDGPVREGTF